MSDAGKCVKRECAKLSLSLINCESCVNWLLGLFTTHCKWIYIFYSYFVQK
jgi:hypothetical protein